MVSTIPPTEFRSRVRRLIERAFQTPDVTQERDDLLVELLQIQAARVAPYRTFIENCGIEPLRALTPADFPALPTDVFRSTRVSIYPQALDMRTFVSSGTTADSRSTHAFRDLSLYALAAKTMARRYLFGEHEKIRLLVLAPSEDEAPDSSLSYMLARFVEWFGAAQSGYIWRRKALDVEHLARELAHAATDAEPVALLGTAFAFVHAEDALGARRFHLPRGSFIMHTGGYKGRSRELAPEVFRQHLTERYDVDEAHVVAEYSMTELSSQAYENCLRERHRRKPRRLVFPPWVRVAIIDPATGKELACGQRGLVRIDDLANVDSVAALQTADVGTLDEYGLELHGRAPSAVARGCSISADEILTEQDRTPA